MKIKSFIQAKSINSRV